MRPDAAGLVLLSVFVGVGFGAGCAPHHAPKPTPTNADYRVVLSTQPVQPRQLDPTQFTVSVTDKTSQPITGAQVTVQLAMPTMDMGRNAVVMHGAVKPPGTYLGTGRFTMPGDWQAVVAIDKTGQHAEKIVPLTVR